MRVIPETAMRALRRVGERALFDTCERLTPTPGSGGYGSGVGAPVYSSADSEPCLFMPAGRDEAANQVERFDALLYLQRDSAITNLDRVTITHLHGDAVASPQTFEIVQGPMLTHVFREAKLRLVTDGSEE